VIDALGLSGLTQVAYAGGFDQKEWAEQAFVGTQGPRAGLLTLFDGAPVSEAALAMVPKDAAAMNIGHFDMVKLLALTRDVLGKANPGALAAFEGGMAMAGKQFDLDIEKNIINALGDEWISYRGPLSDEGTHPFVLVQKLRDAAALAKTFDVLEQQVNALAQGRVKIEKMDAGTFEVTGIRLPQITLVWTIRDGHLYISNLEGITPAVEQVEKKGESIVANPGYKAVRAALPAGKACAVTYSEPAKMYPELYRGLMTLLPFARLAGLDLPADLLPMPKKIAAFLTPGGSVSWVDDEGFHFSSRAAMPGAEAMSGQGSPTMVAGASAMGVAILLPSLARAREQARNVVDMNNLRQVGQLCLIWAAQHDGAFPDDLAQAIDDVVGVEVGGPQRKSDPYALLKSAKSATTPLVMTPELQKMKKNDRAAFTRELDKHSDVIYLGKGLNRNAATPDLVLLYQKVGPYAKGSINVLFADCHVETVPLSDLPHIFKATNESLKERGLPEVNVEQFPKKAPGSNAKHSYFMDESTGKEIMRSVIDVPPLKNEKGEPTIVEVVKISFENGKNPHVAYYIKYSPDAQKELQALNALPAATTPDEFRQRAMKRQQVIQKGQWIRGPEKDSPWVLAASPEGQAILSHAADAPGDQIPIRVFPP
jgi:prepilin-type processing-associated H-X9-DG protein